MTKRALYGTYGNPTYLTEFSADKIFQFLNFILKVDNNDGHSNLFFLIWGKGAFTF